MYRNDREHVTGGGGDYTHTYREGGREIRGWQGRLDESNWKGVREGEKEGGGREREINRVAIPPSSQSEAESNYCLRYLS